MFKILFITLITSFISLESQAEDKTCDVMRDDITEMFFEKTLGNCKAGNLMHVWSRDPTLAMSFMLRMCEDKTIQVFNYVERDYRNTLHASCRLMPIKKWRDRNFFKDLEE